LISINQISLDGHTLNGVLASDGAADQGDGSMLLGMGVLQRFGKFSIDTASHQLTLG
jgi:predicted aspartyl protease